MSRNSPQPKVQTRAKRARIHSQKPLNPESDLIAPFPLNKPLEASSVPTTSGFIAIKKVVVYCKNRILYNYKPCYLIYNGLNKSLNFLQFI